MALSIKELKEIHGETICKMRERGASTQKIADEFNTTKGKIWWVLYDSDSRYPKDLLTTNKAVQEIGISKTLFRKIAKKLGLEPIYSSPGRILWSRDAVEAIKSAHVCRICRGPLPKGHYSICKNKECLKDACKDIRRGAWRKYYLTHRRKNPSNCCKCGANLIGTGRHKYCLDCRPPKSQKK